MLRRLLLGVGAAATRPSTRKIRPNVRLSPKATELPCGNGMTRCANNGSHPATPRNNWRFRLGPIEHQLFLIGSGDTGSYAQTTMVLFYGRAPRK